MTTNCRICRKRIDVRTLTAGGEVCFDCLGDETKWPPATTPALEWNGETFEPVPAVVLALRPAAAAALAAEPLQLLARALPMLIQLGDHIGNGPIDPARPESLGARCDLIGDIRAALDAQPGTPGRLDRWLEGATYADGTPLQPAPSVRVRVLGDYSPLPAPRRRCASQLQAGPLVFTCTAAEHHIGEHRHGDQTWGDPLPAAAEADEFFVTRDGYFYNERHAWVTARTDATSWPTRADAARVARGMGARVQR